MISSAEFEGQSLDEVAFVACVHRVYIEGGMWHIHVSLRLSTACRCKSIHELHVRTIPRYVADYLACFAVRPDVRSNHVFFTLLGFDESHYVVDTCKECIPINLFGFVDVVLYVYFSKI